jgi:hypothetical protein
MVGFETYGEQYRAMHLNQTLTGIAIGKRPADERLASEGPAEATPAPPALP